MKRTWVIVVLVVVASTVGTAAQTDDGVCPVDVAGSDEPGQELANVVGAQESVVARELERRGFNATLENASNQSERATVIATELERLDARLTDLETCREALVDARESGDLSASEYRDRAATLEPEIEDVSERLDRAEEAATDLPPAVRQRNDVGEERFEDLWSRVDDLEAFVADPGRAIESANGNDSVSSGPSHGSAGESQATATEAPDDAVEETAVPSTEPTGPAEIPDEGEGEDEKDEDEEGENEGEDGAPESGDESEEANYG